MCIVLVSFIYYIGCRRGCDCQDQIDETDTCTNSTQNRSCVCQRIRRYLRRELGMNDIDNVQVQCNRQLCNVSCNEGLIGDATYLCNNSCNCCTPTDNQEIACERGLCVLKIVLVTTSQQY